ncbi:MAG: repeat-containing protein YrrB [Verrucomicrobiota bacterium]
MAVAAPTSVATASAASERGRIWLGALLLAVAALAAYHNSFGGPFILDDGPAISENDTIKNLAAWRTVLSPPNNGQTVTGRPFLNFSFALNHALGGLDVRGYHALNLAIHLAAGLALFGIVRRTLRRQAAARFRELALPVAFVAALLWTVHPLATESVTYIVQRAESLAGLLYLLTLYAFARGLDSPRGGAWRAAAVGACLLGMATKEVMVTAPVMVWLYDRTFGAGTFRGALRERKIFYASLAATWALLGWLVIATGNRGATAGFGLEITPWTYALKQCEALLHYLRLCVWPHPLVLDYGFDVVKSAREVWPQGLAVCALLAATVVALARWPRGAFFGAWFFALLGPSSSFVPVATQTVAEHRMYLPLAGVVVGLVCLGANAFGRRALWVGLALSVPAALLTARRNHDYRSTLAIWADTMAKRPGNARAFQEYAVSLLRGGNAAAALAPFEEAMRLRPDYARGRHNYGAALAAVGRTAEAMAQYELAIRHMPELPEPYLALGGLLIQAGRWPDAGNCFAVALRLRPHMLELHAPIGNARMAAAQPAEAIPHYEIAVRLAPADADLHNNLGVAYLRSGRRDEAAARFAEALRLRPGFTDAANNLALVRPRAPTPLIANPFKP